MSTRLTSASSEWLGRTSDVIDYNSPYTIMAWVYFVTLPGGLKTVFNLGNTTTGLTFDLLQVGGSNEIRCASFNGGGATDTGATLSTATWYHLTFRRSSTTSLQVYLNGVFNVEDTGSVVGRPAVANLVIGRTDISGFAGEYNDMRVAGIKAWTAALTTTEAAAEMPHYSPVRTANLYGWWPAQVHTDLTDKSGNGRTFTGNNTPSTEADPPGVTSASSHSQYISVSTTAVRRAAVY